MSGGGSEKYLFINVKKKKKPKGKTTLKSAFLFSKTEISFNPRKYF